MVENEINIFWFKEFYNLYFQVYAAMILEWIIQNFSINQIFYNILVIKRITIYFLFNNLAELPFEQIVIAISFCQMLIE